MRSLYLHIGSPKTGTTSIQEIFASNRGALLKQGFLYPGKGRDHHFLYLMSQAPKRIWPRHFKGMRTEKLEMLLQKFLNNLEQDFSRSEDVIISTEYIFFENMEMASNIINYLRKYFDRIVLLCFLREPVGYYRSRQQQKIKGQSFLQSPHSFRYDFRKVINTWEALCDKIKILKFEKTENSFVKLCEVIGIDSNGLKNLSHRTNSSISIEQMILFEKIFRRLYRNADDRLTGKLHVRAITQIKKAYTHKPTLKSGVNSIIYQNHYEDLKWLKQRYGVNLLGQNHEATESIAIPTHKKAKTSVQDIFHIPDKTTVAKYEAEVIDILLRKLHQTAF